MRFNEDKVEGREKDFSKQCHLREKESGDPHGLLAEESTVKE